MTKEIWLNLPVKDINKSKDFFGALGFSFNRQPESANMACLNIGEKSFNVLLFSENTFKGFTKTDIPDTKNASEILISINAESREEVDKLAEKVWEAGGTIFSEPGEIQGWMYGFGFADLDGHRWNSVFMDSGKRSPNLIGVVGS